MTASALSKARLGRMTKVMSGFVERGEMPGLVTLVSRCGDVHVDALGRCALDDDKPMRRDTIFRIASVTKPIVGAAAMILVEECRLRLDDRIDDWLPELANRQVLKRIDAELDDTVPARRSITVRDLFTFCLGFGSVMAPPDSYPIQRAIREHVLGGDGPPKPSKAPATEEWIRRLGALPLMYQPGERWLYNTGADVLGVLIERVSGKTLEAFLKERLFEPLGMKDTAFHVPRIKVERLLPSYVPTASGLAVFDAGGAASDWSRPPPFQSGAGGLVSTADDCLAFFQMLIDKGRRGRERILSRPSVELMTSDQVSPAQRAAAEIFFGGNSSWGFGMAVNIKRDDLSSVPGRFGWTGGLGTSAYADPQEQLVGILLTQRMMNSPEPPHVFRDFWTCAYQAIDD